MTTPNGWSLPLPPTVNLHIVGHCNFACRFCYARFVGAKEVLPWPRLEGLLAALSARGVRRVTFAGGEPTLHPDLLAALRRCADLGLVTSVVTNGSIVDREWCRRHLPWLRWLVLSCDSPSRATCDALGRRASRDEEGQPARVLRIAETVREWNRLRPERDHVHLKINMVVTAAGAHEDPTAWLARVRPARVKLLQALFLPGENEDAVELACSNDAFRRYAELVRPLADLGIAVVAEASEDLLDSYAMIDPHGRFRQARPGGYVLSEPIDRVGVDTAWAQVGGCDLDLFARRGGNYDDGPPSRGVTTPVIAIEGLDGSGKSTVVRILAERLGGAVVSNPPAHLGEQRARAAVERRAWYRHGNVEAMKLATDHVFDAMPVVMDRSFASTAAYAAAEQGRVASFEDVPRRVARPDCLVFLDVPEPVRRSRLRGRAGGATGEERRLERDAAFRERVVAGYRALGADFVPATGSPAQIADEILRLLRAVRRG